MNRLDELALKMAEYDAGDPGRIQHFLKVHAFARLIGVKECLSAHELYILEAAALTHDIGIRKAHELYGRCDGPLQEQLGPNEAREMMTPLGFENDVIERVLTALEPEIAERGVAVQSSLSPELPQISADEDRLFQVFYNVIHNALQSLPGAEGGISIQSRFNDSDVGIIIGDNGCGISHEVMGSMYEPFRTTKKKGHGLGLLIVRHIVKEHGGTLSITSKEGLGTTITITLPRADRVVRLLPS